MRARIPRKLKKKHKKRGYSVIRLKKDQEIYGINTIYYKPFPEFDNIKLPLSLPSENEYRSLMIHKNDIGA